MALIDGIYLYVINVNIATLSKVNANMAQGCWRDATRKLVQEYVSIIKYLLRTRIW